MEANFIPGPRGDLFTVYYPPSPDAGDAGDLIFVPPFAEEMNRSRNIVARQCRALQEIGYGILVLDVSGTGDSHGDFADARWETWRSDVMAAVEWLSQRGRSRFGLWGLRLGGLLATDVAYEYPGTFKQLLLWAPVARGRDYVNQFLRTGVSQTGLRGKSAVTVSGLRLKLSRTEPLEIAGYILSRSMTHAIDRSEMEKLGQNLKCRVTWIEQRAGSGTDNASIANRWRSFGLQVDYRQHSFPSFWALEDAAVPDGLFALTRSCLASPVTEDA